MLELLTYENRHKRGKNVSRSLAVLLVIATAECIPAQRRVTLPEHLSFEQNVAH